jgi:hypothetical protein
LAKSDIFSFLIDIVSREEAASHAKRAGGGAAAVPQPELNFHLSMFHNRQAVQLNIL